MTDQTHIDQCSVPILGDEAAEALMAELPKTEPDAGVTRQPLRADAAQLRAEMAAMEERLCGRIDAVGHTIVVALVIVLPTSIIGGMGLAAAIT